MYAKAQALVVLGALAALPQTFATIFITAPIASTTCQGGQVCTISWKEDDARTAPTLANWGLASVGIYAGSVNQQTLLQPIQDNVNVAANSGIQFTVNPGIGPNSNQYFVRFQSATVKDPTNPTFPLQAFSAKFTLAGMSGQFNATVQAQISGGAAPPTTPTTTTTTTSSSSTSKSSSSTTKTSGTTTPSASQTAGAVNVRVGGLTVAAVGAVVVALL